MKQIVFSFDQQSYDVIEAMRAEGGFNTLAEVLQRSLQINKALNHHYRQGFTEVIVRDPQTNSRKYLKQ